MKGFVALELDDATLTVAVETQKKLRASIERQGVRFTPSDRLQVVLATWDFADPEELERISSILKGYSLPAEASLVGLVAGPVADRPASIDLEVKIPDAESFLTELALKLCEVTPSDLPKRSLLVNLVRVSPPSKKIGYLVKPLLAQLVPEIVGYWRPTTLSLNVQEPTGGVIKTKF